MTHPQRGGGWATLHHIYDIYVSFQGGKNLLEPETSMYKCLFQLENSKSKTNGTIVGNHNFPPSIQNWLVSWSSRPSLTQMEKVGTLGRVP